MKSIKIWFAACLLLAVTSCQKMPEHAKVIPDDAQVVLRIDFEQLASKSGVGNDDAIKQQLGKMLESDLSGGQLETAKSILDDPDESGIDFSEPVFLAYGLESMKSDFAVIFSVGDKDKVIRLFDLLETRSDAKVLKTEGDMSYTRLKDVFAAFDSKSLLLLDAKSYVDESEYVSIAKTRLSESGNSMADIEPFVAMCEKDGDFQLLMNGAVILDMASKESNVSFDGLMPDNVDYKDLYYLSDISFEKGKVSSHTEVVAAKMTDELRAYMEAGAKVWGKLSNQFFKMIPESVLTFGMNIDGEALLNIDAMKKLVEGMDNELLALIKNFKGDVMFALSGSPMDLMVSQTPQLVMYAEIKDQALVETAIDKFFPNNEKLQDGIYCIPVTGLSGLSEFYVKIDASDLCVATTKSAVEMKKVKEPADLSFMEGKLSAMELNLSSIKQLLAVVAGAAGSMGTEAGLAMAMLEYLDRIRMYAGDANSFEVQLLLTNDDENSLKVFVDAGRTLIEGAL